MDLQTLKARIETFLCVYTSLNLLRVSVSFYTLTLSMFPNFLAEHVVWIVVRIHRILGVFFSFINT